MILEFGQYPSEAVFTAQDLYCVDRLTYEAVSQRTGVSVPTLKRWGEKFEWRQKREELASAESQIKIQTKMARLKMLNQVVSKGKSSDAFAVAALENLAIEQEKLKSVGDQIKAPPVSIEGPAQAAALLEAALNQKLGILLSSPATIDLKAIKDLKEALNLLAEMKGKAESTDENCVLTVDTSEQIKKILGGDL